MTLHFELWKKALGEYFLLAAGFLSAVQQILYL